MECDTNSILKIKNENLKEQLPHVVSLSNVGSTSSDWVNVFKKNPHFTRKI